MKPFVSFAQSILSPSSAAGRLSLERTLIRAAPRLARRSVARYTSTSARITTPLRAVHPRVRCSHLPRQWPSPLRNRFIRKSSSSGPNPNPTAQLGSPNGKPSLGQQLKRLFREYGWAGVGVYLLLSAADLPICLLIVRMVGTERVGAAEHAVLRWVKDAWHAVNPLSEREVEPQTMPAIEETSSDVMPAEAATKDGEASRSIL